MYTLLPFLLLCCASPQQEPYRVGNGVTPPAVASKVEPQYTELAREALFQGSIVVSAVVDAEGRPTALEVLKPAGLGLDEEALLAIEQWRFKPGMKDGQPVPVIAQIETTFSLMDRPTRDLATTRVDAERGRSYAQARLGKAYYWGKGVEQDYAEALRLFRLAAADDDAVAESYLGMMYTAGQGVDKDDSQAASFLLRAAEQGNIVAQLNLGIAYKDGLGLSKDYVQAYKWFELAAAKQSAQAVRLRKEVAAKMSPSQIVSAQVMVGEWRLSPSRGAGVR
jgi:TonB family protein